ncbi:ImmA/IrrE family metallo-endopeptidase, partial [uncultured Clostridium sp.]|uniref:ImmA/IrrE family metallo-endopeptidase n=1 Tax=uncultured Clostridium sp. TaxID=59620 RepID=UPI0025E83C80
YNYDMEDIKQITLKIRELWNLKHDPIDNLSYVLQTNGFFINKQYIEQNKTDGFSQSIGDKFYIFISANKECAVRSRFDLAYELGHLVLHRNIDDDEQSSKCIERQADYFASELLYPSDIFINEIQSLPLNFETFIMLKEKWKISIQALIRKCRDLELISEDKYIYFQKKISYNKWRFKEPLDDYIIAEEPRLLKDAIELLIENNIINKRDILMNIELDKKDIIKLCNLPRDYFDESLQNVIKLF